MWASSPTDPTFPDRSSSADPPVVVDRPFPQLPPGAPRCPWCNAIEETVAALCRLCAESVPSAAFASLGRFAVPVVGVLAEEEPAPLVPARSPAHHHFPLSTCTAARGRAKFETSRTRT